MTLEKLLFVVCLLLLLYTWAGYPLLLFVLPTVCKRRSRLPGEREPSISVVVAAHNEAAQIAAKLENCLALEYPPELLEILLASDHSTDDTDEIVLEFAAREPRVRLLRTAAREGKSGAQNLAAEQALGEILLFTDAGTRARPDLLRRIATHFADPEVGMVAPVVSFRDFGSAVSKAQNAYWKFELYLRQWESQIGILATASGAAFAMRRSLFRAIPGQFGDDCVVPLDVLLQGSRVVQDPEAIVSDEMAHTPTGELRARVRMTARNCGGTLSRPQLLNPVRFPGIAWSLLSHKLLRWMTPFFLAGMFLANGLLAMHQRLVIMFLLQCCFYAAALIGWRRSLHQPCERVFGYPFAFCLANAGFLLGTVRCFRGSRITAYK